MLVEGIQNRLHGVAVGVVHGVREDGVGGRELADQLLGGACSGAVMREFEHVNVTWIGVQDGTCGRITREEERFGANCQLDDYRVIVGVGEICVFGGPENFQLVGIGLVDDGARFGKGYLQVIVLDGGQKLSVRCRVVCLIWCVNGPDLGTGNDVRHAADVVFVGMGGHQVINLVSTKFLEHLGNFWSRSCGAGVDEHGFLGECDENGFSLAHVDELDGYVCAGLCGG